MYLNLNISLFSFKKELTQVTSSKDSTIEFLRTHGVLKSSILCPGPSVLGGRTSLCGQYMVLKKINDSKDGQTWRCRKQHSVVKGDLKCNVKDVKLTLRHESWLVDSKVKLELITELIYLWLQEIMHELALSKKTVIEWSFFFHESCFTTVMDESQMIGGNGIEVEIDESKFGKRNTTEDTGLKVNGCWRSREV